MAKFLLPPTSSIISNRPISVNPVAAPRHKQMPRLQPDNTPSVYPGDVLRRPHNRRLHRLCLSLKCCLPKLQRFLCSPCALCYLPITAGFIILFVWVGLAPNSPTVTVENAYLTRFNLTAAAPAGSGSYTLDYNLTVELGLRNGNRGCSVCYRGLESVAYYESQWLTSVGIPDFCQGSKTGGTATLAFHGLGSFVIQPTQVGFFRSETRAGFFLVDVSVKGKVKARLDRVNWKYKSDLDLMCWMKAPLLAGKTSPAGGGAFPRVDCVDVSPQSA